MHYRALSTCYARLAEHVNRCVNDDNEVSICQNHPDTASQAPRTVQSKENQALKRRIKLLKQKLRNAMNTINHTEMFWDEYVKLQNVLNATNQQKINDLQLDLDKRIRFANVDQDRMRDCELKLQEDEAYHRHKMELIDSLSNHRERQILGYGAISRVLGDMNGYMLRNLPLPPYVETSRYLIQNTYALKGLEYFAGSLQHQRLEILYNF